MKQARVMPKPDSKQHGEPVKQTKMANESVPSLLDPADVGWIYKVRRPRSSRPRTSW